MLFGKEVLALLVAVAVAGRPAQGRAVVREDVKGVASLLRDEARGDPFFDDNPQYDFAYRIHDEETGDAKDQSEERRGDAVHGSYSVVDPDGTLRVVRYTADDANGFNAVVSLTPGHAKPFVPKPAVQRRVAVVQNHVDVPVPVQHHVLPSTSQQTLGDRRVLVEHPKHQTGALLQEHLIQPPLAFGLHQDVHHLIPRGPTYQLHHIHQLSPSGVGTHHQMTVPIVQVQNQGEVDAQQQHVAFLQLQEEQLKEQLKQQQAKIQALIEAQQENQLPLKQLQEQKDTPTQVQGLQDHPPAEQQQTSQQQEEQTQQDSNTLQGPQDTASLQQDASSQQGIQQQDVTAQQQQTNAIPQQQGENGGFALPQVIDVRHSVIPKSEPAQALPLQSQLRSLHSEVASPAASPAASPQRTLAVYRTSYGMRGGSNFITFNSPYAQYTIS